MKSAPTNNRHETDQESHRLAALEAKLGYSFRNMGLLTQALTHKSFSQDHNERLEFVGDAVLGYVVAVQLYDRYGAVREDLLSLMRSGIVRGEVLAQVARELCLSDHIRLGTGERKSGGRDRDSILADALEAIIGAIHEDGGIQACGGVITRLFDERIADIELDALKDAKTRLQEVLQGAQLNLPSYVVEETTGADHERLYRVRCTVAELDLSDVAVASSRRQAEKDSAERVLQLIDSSDLI